MVFFYLGLPGSGDLYNATRKPYRLVHRCAWRRLSWPRRSHVRCSRRKRPRDDTSQPNCRGPSPWTRVKARA